MVDKQLLLAGSTILGLGLYYITKKPTLIKSTLISSSGYTVDFYRPMGMHGYGILGNNVYKGMKKNGFIELESKVFKNYRNLKESNIKPDISLILDIPQRYFSSDGYYKVNIGFTMFETIYGIPDSWYEGLNKIDRLFVPIISNVYTFNTEKLSGNINVVPIGIDTDIYNPRSIETNYFNKLEHSYKFLIINDGQSRKNNDMILRAFKEEFHNEINSEDVLLVARLSNTKHFNKSLYNKGIYYVNKFLNDNDLALLINSCDCLVSASSGECGDIPILQAMAMEKIVILSDDRLAHTELIEDALHNGFGKIGFLIDIDKYEYAFTNPEYTFAEYLKGLKRAIWVVPSLEDLKKKMRFVYEHRYDKDLTEIKKNSSRYILKNRNIDTMINHMIEHFVT